MDLNEERIELIKKFTISDDEYQAIFEDIKRVFTYGKKPVDNPTMLLIGGQQGSRKISFV